MEQQILTLTCLLACISLGTALECYVCTNEENNRHGCSRDKKMCDQFQDACTTYVRWGGYALECYTCSNQDSNKDKCIKTTKQCEKSEDGCSTYIRWGVPPYWSPHGERIYYISKDCDTRLGCEKRKDALMTHCKRDWYNDWSCVDCCTGDLCNYYVTLGAGNVKANFMAIVTSVLFIFLFRKL